MAIHRIRKEGNFTQIPNSIINDGRLSYTALGLLVWILSLINNWHFTQGGIAGWNKKYGRRNRKDSIKTALNELISTGYLYCPANRKRKSDGQFADEEWEVYEDYTQNPHYSPPAEKPTADNPAMNTPAAESPPGDNTAGIKIININTSSNNTLLSKTVKNQFKNDAVDLAETEETIKREIGYDDILTSRPESTGLLNVIVREIATVELSTDKYIRIGKDDIIREDALAHFYALKSNHIFKVIDAIDGISEEIKHLDKYVLKALYNAVPDSDVIHPRPHTV